MAESVQAQIDQLMHSIEGLEAQRNLLGEAIINPAMAALKQQLAALEDQAKKQAAPTDERRLVTILFIDMVGSTEYIIKALDAIAGFEARLADLDLDGSVDLIYVVSGTTKVKVARGAGDGSFAKTAPVVHTQSAATNSAFLDFIVSPVVFRFKLWSPAQPAP